MDCLIVSLFGGFVAWYLYFGLTYFLNGGSLGRNQFFMPFVCFFEDCYLNFFGGTKRRANYIKKMIGPKIERSSGITSGKTRRWDDDEVRDKNLFLECANDVLPHPLSFWAQAFLVPLFGFFVVKNIYFFFFNG